MAFALSNWKEVFLVTPKSPKDRIILPLDVSSLEEAAAHASNLANYVGPMKIGLELLMGQGLAASVNMMHAAGATVFADAKLHDIPNTVAAAAKNIADLNVAMFNVHASGGCNMMKAAVANKGKSLLLAVTVLTSLTNEDCRRIYGMEVSEKVLQFALDAREAGVDGIICSPQDLGALRDRSELSNMLFVTPGVRPEWAMANDQKRIMTPAEAIRAGADYLVIGRPILKPPKAIGTPIDAAMRIADEIDQALN